MTSLLLLLDDPSHKHQWVEGLSEWLKQNVVSVPGSDCANYKFCDHEPGRTITNCMEIALSGVLRK
jgi:hypothetical protein